MMEPLYQKNCHCNILNHQQKKSPNHHPCLSQHIYFPTKKQVWFHLCNCSLHTKQHHTHQDFQPHNAPQIILNFSRYIAHCNLSYAHQVLIHQNYTYVLPNEQIFDMALGTTWNHQHKTCYQHCQHHKMPD